MLCFILLRDVQRLVLEHFRNPHNAGDLSDATATVEVTNPVCGDVLRLSVRVDGGRIAAARFKTQGCVAAIASSSVLTDLLTGKSLAEARDITAEQISDALGGLAPRHFSRRPSLRRRRRGLCQDSRKVKLLLNFGVTMFRALFKRFRIVQIQDHAFFFGRNFLQCPAHAPTPPAARPFPAMLQAIRRKATREKSRDARAGRGMSARRSTFRSNRIASIKLRHKLRRYQADDPRGRESRLRLLQRAGFGSPPGSKTTALRANLVQHNRAGIQPQLFAECRPRPRPERPA